jgi:glucose-6-phosphate isomerase
MNNLTLNLQNTEDFVSLEEILALARRSVIHIDSLNGGTGPGSDFTGWLSLPDDINPQLNSIEECAAHLRSVSDTTIVIGIGGSYLGARAITEALSHSFPPLFKNGDHSIIYAGQNLCEDYLSDLLEIADGRDYSIIVISKSGTTTEPAVAFRLLKKKLEEKIGRKGAADRIVAITDARKGALRSLAEENGYRTFAIPDNIGGRYSVLTPVGLLPVSVDGHNIKDLVNGAISMKKHTRYNKDAASNPSLLYAAARNLLLQNKRAIEIMTIFTPRLHYFSEWWKQLYGESEGKNGKGIFPASADMTTDLHSLGQYIQEGQRILFETMISINNTENELTIPFEKNDSDQLNYLAGKRVSEVNSKAQAGTILAHNDGGVPVITVSIPAINEFYLGQMIYFFETACAVSGYILDVNPFDQPGVEAYKRNMFALLNKPGYEESSKEISKRLK